MFKKLLTSIAFLSTFSATAATASDWEVLLDAKEATTTANYTIKSTRDSDQKDFAYISKDAKNIVVNKSDSEIVISLNIVDHGDECQINLCGIVNGGVDTLILPPKSSQVILFSYLGTVDLEQDKNFYMSFRKVFQAGNRVPSNFGDLGDGNDYVSITVKAAR